MKGRGAARYTLAGPAAVPVPELVAFELQDVLRQLWRRKFLLTAVSLAGLGAALHLAAATPLPSPP